jgi:hypothetical protein
MGLPRRATFTHITMGLDQYLYARIKLHDYEQLNVQAKTEERRIQGELRSAIIEKLKLSTILEENSSLMGFFTVPARITIELEVGYWRKCNQIHKFFDSEVATVENGADIYVEREELEELKVRILKVQADHSLAEELLPTEDGFFYGSINYDEGYYQDLEDTIKILDRVLAYVSEDISYYYTANW